VIASPPLQVLKLPLAQLDLLEIWVFIGEDSPSHADRFLDLIEAKLRMLAEVPGLGRSRPELANNLRSFPVGEYHIFYRAGKHRFEVVRVLHGARDIEAIFQDDSL
jgi:toxin ParE1/3/4